MYSIEELKKLIKETLIGIGKHSPDAENLICGIIAQESRMGKYRRQLGGGPALGICQIEPNTFKDLTKFVKKNIELYCNILKTCKISAFHSDDLVNNDCLSICMCRVFFLRFPEKLPSTIEEYAKCWKKYYNTKYGKGTIEEFIENYHKYVLKT